MCIDMCIDMRVHMCADNRLDMCADMCSGIRLDKCADVHKDMCGDRPVRVRCGCECRLRCPVQVGTGRGIVWRLGHGIGRLRRVVIGMGLSERPGRSQYEASTVQASCCAA